ncbi:hypothetical protein [Psychromarinibacter halotolerans]|uniref:Lipoprotein n=1 Tax=Psychromarinibacter halotolerans TaxID=1775175 RepID=A0ABV7GRG2_9RHOB|nr:hypothetical protein [Psychromarinibacter halotolerans]MDF0595406.1 hypothetical protein [Psychromarinibacter halotolerans]
MKPVWAALLVLTFAASCGVDGAPVPPGSGIDPNNITDPSQIDPDGFF